MLTRLSNKVGIQQTLLRACRPDPDAHDGLAEPRGEYQALAAPCVLFLVPSLVDLAMTCASSTRRVKELHGQPNRAAANPHREVRAYLVPRIGVTVGGISTLGFAELSASNWRSFRNITLQPLQAKKLVS
jgi:hypothetical protein